MSQRRRANSGRRQIAAKWGPLTVGEDEYLVRINPPIATFVAMQSGDLDRIVVSLSSVIREHPFIDDDGDPLPFSEWTLDEILPFVDVYVKLVNALPPG